MCPGWTNGLAGWRGRIRTTESVRTEIRFSCRENFARFGQRHVQRPFQCELRVRESSTAAGPSAGLITGRAELHQVLSIATRRGRRSELLVSAVEGRQPDGSSTPKRRNCSDAQLHSPSPPMQSKTVALAPMPASMPSRSAFADDEHVRYRVSAGSASPLVSRLL